MKTSEDRLLNTVGACLFLLIVAAAAGWYIKRRVDHVSAALLKGVPYPGPILLASVSTIHLAAGSTPAKVEATALASGYQPLTNVAFNDLIPADQRSPEFAGAALYRYATTNTNDDRVLALPPAGTNCYLYVHCFGDSNLVMTSEGEAQQLARKLAHF